MGKSGEFIYEIDDYTSIRTTWQETLTRNESGGGFTSTINIQSYWQQTANTQEGYNKCRIQPRFTIGGVAASVGASNLSYPYDETWSATTAFKYATIKVDRGNATTDVSYDFKYDITPTLSSLPAKTIGSSGTLVLSKAGERAKITAFTLSFNQTQDPMILYEVPEADRTQALHLDIGYNPENSLVFRDIVDINYKGEYTVRLTDEEREAICAGMPNSSTGNIYFYLSSWIDDVKYTDTAVSTLRIIGGNPEFLDDTDVSDINEATIAVTGSNKVFVRHESTARFTLLASGNLGAKISYYQVVSGSIAHQLPSYETHPVVTIDIEDIPAWPCIATAVDTRGNRTDYTVKEDYLFIPYIEPTCNLETHVSANSEIFANIKGAVYAGSFDADGNKPNTVKVEYRHKLKAAATYSEWIEATGVYLNKKSNTYDVEVVLTGLNYREPYVLQARVVDSLNTIESVEKEAIAQSIFDWSMSDFNFNVPVNINGDLYMHNKKVGWLECGTWEPQCNACYTPSVSYGNYMRMGDMCIVNFYYQGVIDVEPSTTEWKLYFYGLPFTPDSNIRWQCGGGNCQGYALPSKGNNQASPATYTPATGAKTDHRFSGWSIEGGVIYGRTQCGFSSDDTATTENVTGNTNKYGTGINQLYKYVKPEGSWYITALPGQTFYASGTILYKLDEEQGGIVG